MDAAAGPDKAPDRPPAKPARRTARVIARETLTAEILATARRHLVDNGADGLSLRAIARDVGMVSSAIYRYFASRDELLTALLIESYNALGAAAEQAAGFGPEESPSDPASGDPASGDPVPGDPVPGDPASGDHGERFVAVCRTVRQWAIDHPQQWALLYGSPVPGYAAPRQTVEPAARLPLTLVRLVVTAYAAGDIVEGEPERLPAELSRQALALAEALDTELPDWLGVRVGGCFTQLMGTVSAELYGHLVGSFDPADAMAEYTWRQMATRVGFVGYPASD